MDRRQSAYAELGLRPGADRAQVEEAYRRLIKLYHPDRPGGDGGRAAEITRAYRELRDNPGTLPVRLEPAFATPVRPSRRGAIAIACLAAALALIIGGNPGLWRSGRRAVEGVVPAMAATTDGGNEILRPLDDFEEPLSIASIDRSAADALKLYRRGNPTSLAAYSQGCQSQFRDHPDVVWFDSCAAYDEAVVLLQSRDPLADSGTFNPTAVTAREMGAAGLLSDDSLAADSRLHKIRSRVEFVLLSNSSQ
jgi:hypothetical protein